jgi:hypothetical protein
MGEESRHGCPFDVARAFFDALNSPDLFARIEL